KKSQWLGYYTIHSLFTIFYIYHLWNFKRHFGEFGLDKYAVIYTFQLMSFTCERVISLFFHIRIDETLQLISALQRYETEAFKELSGALPTFVLFNCAHLMGFLTLIPVIYYLFPDLPVLTFWMCQDGLGFAFAISYEVFFAFFLFLKINIVTNIFLLGLFSLQFHLKRLVSKIEPQGKVPKEYKTLQVLSRVCNSWWQKELIPIFTGLLLVFSVYAFNMTLTQYNALPLVVYTMYPAASLFFLYMVKIFVRIAIVMRISKQFCEDFNRAPKYLRNRKNVMLQKLGESLRPIGIRVGGLGFLDLDLVWIMANNIITGLVFSLQLM
ncbi:unnamed protein product, partial [Allacma fusca]